MLRLEAGTDDDGRRIDRILRKAFAEMPVSAIYRLLRKGLILLDGKPVQPQNRVSAGQIIEVGGTNTRAENRRPHRIAGAVFAIGREIAVLYEGQGILALSKPCGITAQEELGALVRDYLAGKLPPSLSFSPGPLHRLDKGASGVMVFGKSLAGARKFSDLMGKGMLQKTYIALLEGGMDAPQVWRDWLAYSSTARKTRITGEARADSLIPEANISKYAETRAFPLEVRRGLTLAKIIITSGRTHQIRAQSAAHGFPLYGDVKYGGKNRPPFFLHACRLGFPAACPFPRSISAPLPSAFEQKLLELGFHRHILSEFAAGGSC
jgi:23S rRNA pseudouridine955/2504/2580 synthase